MKIECIHRMWIWNVYIECVHRMCDHRGWASKVCNAMVMDAVSAGISTQPNIKSSDELADVLSVTFAIVKRDPQICLQGMDFKICSRSVKNF